MGFIYLKIANKTFQCIFLGFFYIQKRYSTVFQIFGKALQNNRKHLQLKLTTDTKQARRLIAKPNCRAFTIINENLTLVSLTKTEVMMDRPVAVGCTILDISKLIVYKWHYGYILNKFKPATLSELGTGDNAQNAGTVRLFFSDTDLLCYQIFCEDLYDEIRKDMDKYFDRSDYPKDHKCYSDRNKKKLGYFKDETCGVPIVKFVGLRSKMYSILLADDSVKNTAKRIQQHFSKTKLKHELYKLCLEEELRTFAEYNSIRSFKHDVYTIHENKVALSSFDDKRYLLKDSHNTLAYGHYKIPKK